MDTKEDSDIFSYLSLSGPRQTGLSWGANFMVQHFIWTNRWATRKRLACGLRHHAHLPHLSTSAVRVTHRHKQAFILLDGSHASQEGNHHDYGTHIAKKTSRGSRVLTSSARVRTAKVDPIPRQFHAITIIELGGAAPQPPPLRHP